MNPHEKPELLIKSNLFTRKFQCSFMAIGQSVSLSSLFNILMMHGLMAPPSFLLIPTGHNRAIARFWAAFVEDKLVAKKSVLEKICEALLLLEEALINCSKGKAYFGGDNVGYLDTTLGSHVGWIRVYEVMAGTKFLDKTKTPRLVGWTERLFSDSPIKDVMLDPQKLLELLKKFKAMSKDASD